MKDIFNSVLNFHEKLFRKIIIKKKFIQVFTKKIIMKKKYCGQVFIKKIGQKS